MIYLTPMYIILEIKLLHKMIILALTDNRKSSKVKHFKIYNTRHYETISNGTLYVYMDRGSLSCTSATQPCPSTSEMDSNGHGCRSRGG